MTKIQVCCGKKCLENGAKALLEKAELMARSEKYRGKVTVEPCACMKKCRFGANIKIVRDGRNHIKSGVKGDDLEKIFTNATALRGGTAGQKLNTLLSGGF